METPFSRIRQWLKPPVFSDDEDKTRTASLLNSILWGAFVVTVLFSALILLFFGIPHDLAETFTFLSGIIVFALSIWLRFLTFRGHVKAAGLILTAVIWAIITFWIATEVGGGGDNSFFVYPLIIALAGLLVGGWAAIGFTVACILVQSGLVYAEIRGILSYPETTLNFFDIVVGGAALLLMGLLIRHVVRNTQEGFERALRNERALANHLNELVAQYQL